MVQIPVIRKILDGATPDSRTPESVLIEMQGELMTDNDRLLAGHEIGTLHFADPSVGRNTKGHAHERAVFLVGNYALTGEVMALPKPFAVLRKQVITDSGDTETVLEMETVIRRKVLFKDRPRHIIPNVPT